MSNPQGPIRKPLKDYSRELLESLLATCESKFPAATVTNYEDARDPLKLAFNAGRHSIVAELKLALKDK